jgi:type II secretory pathway component PulK
MGRGRHGGYALLLVLGTLALMAFVIGQLALRVDELRSQSGASQAQAEARLRASQGFSLALHWVITQPGGPSGFGMGDARLAADGRPYRLDDGTRVAVQDQRGLLSLNWVDDAILPRLLLQWGATPAQRDTLIDVLKDYTDTDTLRRLNGAEAADYAERGLMPPANDWLVSVRELARMPVWRESASWVARLDRLASVRRSGDLNPNVMPLELLRVSLPLATPEQITLFDTLRRAGGFADAASARRATGLIFPEDTFVFHTSHEISIIVWAPGMSRALEYQVTLAPGGNLPPWLVREVRPVEIPLGFQDEQRLDPFPPSIRPSARP